MLNNEFVALAKDIVSTYRTRLNATYTPKYRIEVIQNFTAELKALKEAYAVVYTPEETQEFTHSINKLLS